jgi:hypothetical protein
MANKEALFDDSDESYSSDDSDGSPRINSKKGRKTKGYDAFDDKYSKMRNLAG